MLIQPWSEEVIIVCGFYYNIINTYSETSLNLSSLGPTFVFRINWSWVYAGKISKDLFKVRYIHDSGLFGVYRILVYLKSGIYWIFIYLKFGIYKIMVYLEFGIYRILVYFKFCIYRILVYLEFGIYRILVYYTPAPRRGRGVYCFTSVRLSVHPRYFSSHFSQ